MAVILRVSYEGRYLSVTVLVYGMNCAILV